MLGGMKKAEITKVMREMGKRGGLARAKALGPERRSEIAKKANQARIDKRKAAKEANESR